MNRSRLKNKFLRSYFVILDLSPPLCRCTYAFSLHTLLPSTKVRMLFLYYFVNYCQSKNQKQLYKIKKLLHKATGKCRIKTPQRALRSILRFLTIRWRWEWIILVIWIAHFILFLFGNKSQKKNYGARTPRPELPPPPIRARTLLDGPVLSFHSERTYFTDDPNSKSKIDRKAYNKQSNYCLTLIRKW